MEDNKKLTLRINKELHKKIKLECVELDISMNQYIIQLLEEKLKK